jgi:hypothetical protein
VNFSDIRRSKEGEQVKKNGERKKSNKYFTSSEMMSI